MSLQPQSRLFSFDLGFHGDPVEPAGAGDVSPFLCAPGTDVVLASVLMTVADNAQGGAVAKVRLPRVSFTTNLTVALGSRPPADGYRTTSAILHNGGTAASAETRFTTAAGDVFAISQGSFIRSPNPAHVTQLLEAADRPVTGMVDRPLFEFCRIEGVRRGEVRVEPHENLMNGSGLLHGGFHTVLHEAAVLSADATPGAAVLDMSVTYLRGAKAGPVRAVATRIGGAPDDAGPLRRYRVELRDAGNDDRLCSVVTATAGDPDRLLRP